MTSKTGKPSILTNDAIGSKQILGDFKLNHKDCILYALGINFSRGKSHQI